MLLVRRKKIWQDSSLELSHRFFLNWDNIGLCHYLSFTCITLYFYFCKQCVHHAKTSLYPTPNSWPPFTPFALFPAPSSLVIITLFLLSTCLSGFGLFIYFVVCLLYSTYKSNFIIFVFLWLVSFIMKLWTSSILLKMARSLSFYDQCYSTVYIFHSSLSWGFPGGSVGGEDPLEKEMETHSSLLAWGIPWTEEPGGLQSMGSQKSWTWLGD